MKLFNFLKKSIFFSGLLNLIIPFFTITTIAIVLSYNFLILKSTNYQPLATNATYTVDYDFSYVYVNEKGLASFFSAPLGTTGSTWYPLFITFFSLTLILLSFNFLVSLFTLYLSLRYKNSDYVYASLTNMFALFYGYFVSKKAIKKDYESKPTKTKKSLLQEMEDSILAKIEA